MGTYPKPGQWTTFRIKLTDIVSGGADGWKENMGMFVFSIKDDSDIDRELFFDNFRVEMVPRTLNK